MLYHSRRTYLFPSCRYNGHGEIVGLVLVAALVSTNMYAETPSSPLRQAQLHFQSQAQNPSNSEMLVTNASLPRYGAGVVIIVFPLI